MGATVDVRGTAFSPGDFAEYRLLAGAGAAPTSWELVRRSTLPVSAGLLGTWTPATEGPYVLALEAEDDSGNQARVAVAVIVDHSPPPAPHLQEPIDSGPADTLIPRWTPPAAEDIAGYLVYRNGQLANAPGIVIGDLRPFLVPGPAYADTLLPDGQHCYRVVAMDEAGNMSVPSNTVCRTLDNRRPQATIVEPPPGTRFEFPLHLLAYTPDLDVTSVKFELKPSVGGDWQLIGAADSSAPYQQTLDPVTLAPGPYLLRAVAFDHAGPSEEDPVAIEVIYGDATAPAPPTNLVGWSDGGEVALSWSASPEPDIDGYHVYRDGERLTAAPQTGTTFADPREEGTYEYSVTAIDADENESLPATVEVTLYRPTLLPLIPPTTDGPTATLRGSGARGSGTIEIVRDGAVVAQAPSVSGAFTVPAVPVAPGPSVMVARERDAAGRISLSSTEVVVIGNAPPPPVTNLAATLDDHDVHLSWDAQAGIFGYRVTRDGTDITGTMTPGVSSATASDWLPGYDPPNAVDGILDTLWLPTNVEPSSWSVEFPEPALVARVKLAFADPQGPVAAPAHRISAEWNGRLLPLLDATASANSSVDYTLTLPFATTHLQIALTPTTFVGLAEVGVTALTVVSPATPTTTDTAPDGVHSYGVTAIDGFGSRGPVTSLEVPVGDVVAPPAPTGLVATVTGSDVALSWDPVAAPDLAAYVVRRDGVSIATVPTPSFVDEGRPNGTYSYTVRARDAVGNESPDSAPASAVVSVSPPEPPVLSAAAPPDGGVQLTWTHVGSAPHFIVARALVAGGPYTTVARTGPITTYLDGGTQPGLRAFYIVSAEDTVGNPSAPSNEASAVPVLPRPVLLRPTDAAHPLQFAGNQTAFDGRSFPDALVALTVNGELRGATLAGRAYQPIEIASLPPNATVITVSPNGRLVGFIVEDPATGSVRSEWKDLLTGASGTLPSYAVIHAFSPDERRLAYALPTCDEPGCTFDLNIRDLDTGATSVVENGPRDVSESAWSPSGDVLAIVSSEPGGSATRLDVVDLTSGLTRTIAQWEDTQSGIRWSPSGAEIAVMRRDPVALRLELVVHASDGSGAPEVAAEPIGSDMPEWERSGRRIAYQDLALSLREWDLDTGAVEQIVDDASQPRFSWTGRYLSYVRSTPPVAGGTWLNRLFVRDRTSGTEHEVPTSTSQGGSSAQVLHQWLSADFLTAASSQHIRLVAPFDGAFRVPAVALDPGPNVVEAEAIEVQAGAISDPSEPVTITTPLAAYPDLLVTPSDLASYPTVPLAGQAIALSARVHNRGLAAASNVTVRLELRGAAGVLIDQMVTISAIPAGGTTVVSAYGSATAPGTYLFRAEADADQSISESNEQNNAVQSHVARLRASLAGVGRDLVETMPGGYRLSAVGVDVDADGFERLAYEGHRRLTARDLTGAAGVLTDTLAVWRGSPYSDFPDVDFAVHERTRLVGLHATVVEDLAEARLETGAATAATANGRRAPSDPSTPLTS